MYGCFHLPTFPDSWCQTAANRLVVTRTWSPDCLFLISGAVKNFKTRCEGLAPGLFVFSILGNITYALSIIAASRDADYLIRNASWLAGICSRLRLHAVDQSLELLGSGLTVFLDILVGRIALCHKVDRFTSHIFRCLPSSFITDSFQCNEAGLIEVQCECIHRSVFHGHRTLYVYIGALYYGNDV